MDDRIIDPAKAFLGAGWSYPVQADQSDTDVARESYEEDIRQAMLLILETNRGERVMRPDFGAGLRVLAFEPINNTTMALARHQVEEALTLWEPRVDSIVVNVSAEPALGKLILDIEYRVRTTNTFYNLVYPFFMQEGKP